MFDSGMTHPKYGIETTYMVIVLISNYALDQIQSSIELITDNLHQAKLTKKAIEENKWRLGDLDLPWQQEYTTLRSVEIKTLINPLLRGKI